MNQLEQLKQEAVEEINKYPHLDDLTKSSLTWQVQQAIDKAYLAGQEAERERTNNIITKERHTWARESIGDKALQSLEIALINSKE